MTNASNLGAAYPEMAKAQSEIGGIASSLAEEHRRLERDMADFLDGDWAGPAAASFRAHFQEWTEGAGAVLIGLDHMSSLIGATMSLYEHHNGNIRQDLDRYVQRLGLV